MNTRTFVHVRPTTTVEGPSATNLADRFITFADANHIGDVLHVQLPDGFSRERVKSIVDLFRDGIDEARAGERAQAAE